MKALIMIVAMLTILTSEVVASQCNPKDGMVYIIFFGGAGDDWENGPRLVSRTADKWRRHYSQYVIKYYTWNKEKIATEELRRMLNDCPHEESKIVLIGHSWGGDTAYAVADALDEYAVALVTLDPVSTRAWNTYGLYPVVWVSAQDNRIRNPTTGRGIWVNVHAQSSGETDVGTFLSLIGFREYLMVDSCGAVAWAGGPWGRQDKADQSQVLVPAPFDTNSIILTHCHVGRMLSQSFGNVSKWNHFLKKHMIFPIPEFYPEDE